jgi:hypothetical protein
MGVAGKSGTVAYWREEPGLPLNHKIARDGGIAGNNRNTRGHGF